MLEQKIIIRIIQYAEKQLAFNIFQQYLHELAVTCGEKTYPIGEYPYKYFDLYWIEDTRHPYLLLLGETIVGLVLVREIEEEDGTPQMSIAEFYVLPSYRRRGIGTIAFQNVVSMYPGRWELSVHENNIPSKKFWNRIIGELTGGKFQVHPNPNYDGITYHF